MAILPKELMFDWTMTFASPMTEFCTPGRQTVAHDLTEHLAIKAQLPPDDVERRRLFGKMDQAEDHADGL